MLTLRKSNDRGHAQHGWLESRHTFSFGDYYDPKFTGFRNLLVINEDRVAPGKGFGTHPHSDMEIISYVLEGALQHADSMGTGSIILPGDVQRMTAGTGVTHSEQNASKEVPVHFLQIWILPEKKGIKPSYEQKTFDESGKLGKLKLVASRDGRDGSVTVHQDICLYVTVLNQQETVTFENRENRNAWVQVARGSVRLNGLELAPGDGVAVTGQELLTLQAFGTKTEVLLFDLG